MPRRPQEPSSGPALTRAASRHVEAIQAKLGFWTTPTTARQIGRQVQLLRGQGVPVRVVNEVYWALRARYFASPGAETWAGAVRHTDESRA